VSRRVAVLDHNMGNLRSVAKALEAAGARVAVTAEPDEIQACDALCVPGQGIFGRCMSALVSGGTGDLVRDWVAGDRPFLGICLGMQVLFEASEESPEPGLGILPGGCRRLRGPVTIPHIGWNEVDSSEGRTYYYFDHSFAAHPAEAEVVDGWCEHGERFAASVRRDRLLAVQFHPEKSGAAGLRLLKGWVDD
jgi:imidazole glycerol-phosphate synthase subunit HisH